MYLVGDVGGTKTSLALMDPACPKKLKEMKKYKSGEYKGLLDIVQAYLQEVRLDIKGASFGIAGPVREQRVQATNLPWVIDAKQIAKSSNIKNVYLLNDLEANAYGLFALEDTDFFVLNKGENQKGNQALLSAGTGLGEAGLFFDGIKHTPFACEGGHCDFAPRNDLEMRLLAFTMKTFPHVSYERFLSGSGIALLYHFLLAENKESFSPEMKALFKEKDPAEVISKKGMAKEDFFCMQAIDLFVSIYGAEAGNVALKFLSLNGLYLGGGIAPKILEKFKEKTFFSAYKAKGRFEKLLTSIPIKIVLNDQAALLGAGQYILRKI